MSLLSRTTRGQPLVVAPVDWSNPITRKLSFLWDGKNPTIDKFLGSATTVTGNPSSRSTKIGVSPDFSGSQDFRWGKPAVGSSPTECTLFAYAQSDNNTIDQATVICTSYSASANELIRIHQIPGASGWTLQSRDYVGTNLFSLNSNYPVVNGEMVFIVAVWKSSTQEKSIWINGVKKNASTTNTGTQSNLNQTEIGVMARNSPTQRWDGAIPLAGMFSRALSDYEIRILSNNPWALFKPRNFYIPTVAVSSGTDVNPSAGTLALTGYAPTVAQTANQAVTPNYGSLAITGYAPGVAQSAGTDVIPGAGSLTISGHAPTIAQPVALAPGYGSLTLAGYAPSVTQSAGANVLPGVGALALTGYAPGIAQPIAVQPAAGSLAITGYAPTVEQPKDITAGVGSVTITGYAPSVARTDNQAVVPGAGALSLTGYVPSVVQASTSPNIAPGAGALSLVGHAPTVEQSQPAATGGGGRFKRKRVFIDGKEHFLNPLEVASLLIERAAAKPEAGDETASIPEAAAVPAADPVYAIPAVDYEAVRARADVQASQVFIDRMNAEIERMHRLAVQRQLDEEDDIECLMLLL